MNLREIANNQCSEIEGMPQKRRSGWEWFGDRFDCCVTIEEIQAEAESGI